MPVYIRAFYIGKLNKMFADQKKELDKQTKATKKSMPKVPKFRKP
tara:strand:+ start:738 stop:872 length:135 start_codon:yes stop_codon:yes gene_type:complete